MEKCVLVNTELDIVAARQNGRELAKSLGFGEVDQARITTAISELARNIYLYAGSGRICLSKDAKDDRVGILVVAEDQGPGIRDIHKVMQDGFSTSGGLGAGLPGVKRLMDDFNIQSTVGRGTIISTIKWLR